MLYQCKLLKDLPNFKAGTEFFAWKKPAWYGEYTYISSDKTDMRVGSYDELLALVDNAEWVERKAARQFSKNLCCPVCGETNAFVESTAPKFSSVMDSEDCGVILRYVCEHPSVRL